MTEPKLKQPVLCAGAEDLGPIHKLTWSATEYHLDFRVSVFYWDGEEAFADGHVKWDGCSNVDFPGIRAGGAMLHFCGLADGSVLGRMMGRVYALAAEHVPAWTGDC